MPSSPSRPTFDRSTPPPNSSPPTPTHHSNQQQQRLGHNHSHSHLSGLSSSTGNNINQTTSNNTTTNTSSRSSNQEQQQRYRASVDTMGNSSTTRNWGSASIRPTANNSNNNNNNNSGGSSNNIRPASELLQSSASHNNQSTSNFASPETEAIDRWFEDLQHYEATLEEMAAASLDTNFKEELSAIEQWFRVLSEAERTAALYSLLQSSTQVQMRFFVTVLQQMARADPMTALLSPSNPAQLSMEDQMEAKLASMGLKSPASPAIRQFARQSLGAPITSSEPYLSPHSATPTSNTNTSNNNQSQDDTAAAAAALASQRSKLKANARISAPANILLGASGAHHEALKSPLWNENERVNERRSPSPNRPKSTGSNLEAQPNGSHAGQHLSQSTGPPSSASFLRSPLPTQTDYDHGQLSPALGGNWASMVNTPLVPMFGNKDGSSGMEQGNFGGITQPGLDGANTKLGNWQSNGNDQGIVLDDVRKFRRSARISGSATTGFGGVNGGALGGMYDESINQQQQQQLRQSANTAAQTQQSIQSMQQNAINLGLAGLTNRPTSPGLLSPQHAALSAQQNWRNGLASPNSLSPNGQDDQFTQQLTAYGLQPHSGNNPLSANAQLANLIALQQQMMQQQQQFQQLNMAAAAGIALTPVQLLSLQQQQQQVRMMGMAGMGLMGNNVGGGYGMGIGMGGMNAMGSPRRSPRPNDRSPGGNSSPAIKSSSLPSATGSGSNPDEPIDLNLLSDVASWLRSLRLHKYTSNFETSNWKEMIMLDDAGLEAKGVSALGARRKLLKVFETVRGKMGMALPGDEVNRKDATGTSVLSVSPVGDRDD